MRTTILRSLLVALFFIHSTAIATAHFGGSAGEHGTYIQELLEWPPHLRQLHYYAEVGAGLIMIGFIIAGIIQRLRTKKKPH